MKISQRLRQVQYLPSHDKITSFAGLKHITDVAQRLGILRVLREEQATRRHLYDLEVPAPTTAGERIRTFTLGHIRQLESAVTTGVKKLVLCAGLSGPITLDVDSSILEVHGYLKEGARYGYSKVKGFHPLPAFWAETRLLIGVRLRSGNRHRADGVVSSLGECVGRLPEGERIRLRLDAGSSLLRYHLARGGAENYIGVVCWNSCVNSHGFPRFSDPAVAA